MFSKTPYTAIAAFALVCAAFFMTHAANAQTHAYIDNHPKDDEKLAEQDPTVIKPPAAPPLPVEGKVLIRPKAIIEVPFHINPFETMRQAEKSEKAVQKAVKNVEDRFPKAFYSIMFYLPMTRTGPMHLPRDPNIYLMSVMNEIRELKIPSNRMKVTREYKYGLKEPRIIVYCYRC